MCKATSGTRHSSRHVEASQSHVFQTCVALKGSQMDMTNSVIWVRLSATHSPLQGLFPVYVKGHVTFFRHSRYSCRKNQF